MFYSQAPWPQCTKLGTNVAKGIICDVVVFFFFFRWTPLSYSVEKRRDPKNCAQKLFAQKKGKKSYDSYKYLLQFRWFQV